MSITEESINIFHFSTKRNENTGGNNMRENIICAIYNNEIPSGFYSHVHWKNFRFQLFNFLKNIFVDKIYSIQATKKAGRKFNYDIELLINYTFTFKIEFKYNSCSINKLPQFVSVLKPFLYFHNQSYEEYFYSNYFNLLCEKGNCNIPDKETYLKDIQKDIPTTFATLHTRYYKGCKTSSKFTKNIGDIEFYNLCNSLSKESIKNFVEMAELNIAKLTEYLIKSQDAKHYMMFKNGNIYYETLSSQDLQIVSYTRQPSKYRFILTSISNCQYSMLLRWKRGNGISMPGFQIKKL